ncbi:hypothetical protein KKF29_00400 [Patescibacteria group bacterium]|nr:hypothetical protein [Patescibacteria group bacterium]
MKKLITLGFFYALGEGIYVFLVAIFMLNAEKIFGKMPGPAGITSLLMIFVLSAAISGALVLGKPILLYQEGKKLEAVKLFFLTLGWLLVFLAILLLAMHK